MPAVAQQFCREIDPPRSGHFAPVSGIPGTGAFSLEL